jgi:DNA-binding response OmpR family regulator
MAGKTILAIDNDTETTQQMVSILEAEDYLVFTAPNRDIGIAMAKKVNPSLIFINPARRKRFRGLQDNPQHRAA